MNQHKNRMVSTAKGAFYRKRCRSAFFATQIWTFQTENERRRFRQEWKNNNTEKQIVRRARYELGGRRKTVETATDLIHAAHRPVPIFT